MEDQKDISIDFTNADSLDEVFAYKMFGNYIKMILNGMFGGYSPSASIRGSSRQIKEFSKTIGSEKRYIDSVRKFGLDNPKTFKDKSKLSSSISKFEKATGIKWPLK